MQTSLHEGLAAQDNPRTMSLQAPFHGACLLTGLILNGSPHAIHLTGLSSKSTELGKKLYQFGNTPHEITFLFEKK